MMCYLPCVCCVCICVCVCLSLCVFARSYHTWRLMCSELPPAHMDQVVLGIKEHRESLGGAAAQPVNVCVSSTHTAARLRALVGDSEHVSITVQT